MIYFFRIYKQTSDLHVLKTAHPSNACDSGEKLKASLRVILFGMRKLWYSYGTVHKLRTQGGI